MRLFRLFKRRGYVVPVCGVALLCGMGLAGAGAAMGPVTLVSADDNRIVFDIDLSDYSLSASRFVEGAERFEITGFGTFSVPGEPLIPGRDYLVALPPGFDFGLRYTIQRSQPLGRRRLEPVPFPLVQRGEHDLVTSSEEYRIDRAVYDRASTVAGVSARPEGRLRHQRVLPVRVMPVTYDPVTGETVLATSIRVEITLSGAGDLRDEGDGPPVVETDAWERIYARALVNPLQAHKWRTKPRPHPRHLRDSQRASQATAGPLVKLKVRESALHRVSASTVIGAGFPVGTPTSQLHLFQRWYNETTMAEEILDIPFKLVESASGVSGEFDGTDYVVFYGQRLREDSLRSDFIEKFSDHNVYWLGASAGTPMTQKTVPAGTVNPDTATASFPVNLYQEKDLFFMEETPDTMRPQVPRVPMREFYYYNGGFVSTFSAPFTLGAIKTGGTFQVKARFLGGDVLRSARKVRIEILNSKGTTRLTDADVPLKNVVDYTSAPVSTDLLAEGTNTLRIQPIGRSAVEALLDWFTLEYDSPYRAVADVLDFNTGVLTGSQNLTVTGISDTDVMLFDVTNPLSAEECQLDASHFTDVGGGRVALSFQVTIGSQRRFWLSPLDKIQEIPAGDVVGDEPSSLIGEPAENGVDILVVSHRDFMDEIQRWVDYRRAQGYRVLVADAEDIFDEFNGGVNNARAIRRFVRHFFDKGGASFLVLVGDASEDGKRVHSDSGINFVPTESFSEHVFSRVFNEDEVVTTDKWYVMLNKDIVY
ncbi:MAG: C25 family cysteine peptidase, partial [Candidatus Krumholzibacteria bacterium]|nr:C25 family cysteine peptidase [Candidatus Krumholzibacteria bacterium]